MSKTKINKLIMNEQVWKEFFERTPKKELISYLKRALEKLEKIEGKKEQENKIEIDYKKIIFDITPFLSITEYDVIKNDLCLNHRFEIIPGQIGFIAGMFYHIYCNYTNATYNNYTGRVRFDLEIEFTRHNKKIIYYNARVIKTWVDINCRDILTQTSEKKVKDSWFKNGQQNILPDVLADAIIWLDKNLNYGK